METKKLVGATILALTFWGAWWMLKGMDTASDHFTRSIKCYVDKSNC